MDKQPVRIRPLRDPVIKIKKTHPDATLPQANNQETGTGDTGFDLVAVEDAVIQNYDSAVVPVGLTLADIDPGYWIRIEPRSGLGFKHNIQPHLGVIDNGYRGDLAVKLYNFGENTYHVKKGDKIAQLAVYPLIQPTFEFVDDVTETARGAKGFGSSDNVTRPPFPGMNMVKETPTDAYVTEQIDDDWDYANFYRNGVKYISNPMKVDMSDPDYIPDPNDTQTTSDGSTTYK